VEHLLYADYIKIFCHISSTDDCHRLQNNLLFIMNWCEVNNLKVNVAKCNDMSFSKWKKPITYDYKIHGSVLTRAVVVKNLGVTFDTKLSFVPHIRSVVSSCFKTYGFVVRNSNYICV
jgi:isoprenylcysteine carboxyl methyltransferase (ICMT) family protein YpbQ